MRRTPSSATSKANKRSAEPAVAARVTKPDLPRTEPIRSWSTLFGPTQDSAVNGSGSNGFGANGFGPGGFWGDSVGRGVELGYRVIDDYMRQGASVAGAFSGATTGAGPSRDDVPRMTQRMLQYTSDLTSLWFDVMKLMPGTSNGPPKSQDGDAMPHAAGSGAAASARSRFVLDVKSARSAEIIVTLDERVRLGLTVEPLRASSGRGSITGVTIEPASGSGGALRVKVHVPATLRRGRYTGSVLEAANRRACGRITVVVLGA